MIRSDVLSNVFDRFDGPVYSTGMNALVRAVLCQHRLDAANGLHTAGYVTGYRGSPLGGFDMALSKAARRLSEASIYFEPGLNEDLAATAIWGTQQIGLFEAGLFEGVFGVWYGKGPGVDRSADAFRHANLAGTSARGGAVVLAGDDHTCKSSTTAHQSEPTLMACGIPIIVPAGIEEIVPSFLAATAMSRFSGCWVALKCLTEVMDSSSVLPDGPIAPFSMPRSFLLPPGGVNIRRSDTPQNQEERLFEHKLPAAAAFAWANQLDRVTIAPDRKRIGIVTTGKSWLDLRTAFELVGLTARHAAQLGVGVYKVGLVWPLVEESIRDFTAGYEEIVVIEEKRPIVEDQLRGILYALSVNERPSISGKRDPSGRKLFSSIGELDAVSIARVLAERMRAHSLPIESALPSAPPSSPPVKVSEKREAWFCAGCPHNTSTKLPEGSVAGAGIGCHGLAAFNDPDTTLPFTQMGGEGANWIGRRKFVDRKHIFQNMGDGTFNHSGLLAIKAAVAAGSNVTFKILFNDAVAMTGGQAHEGTLDVTAIVRQTAAAGAVRIAVVADDPNRHHGRVLSPASLHRRDELDAVQRSFRDVRGVTVIVYDQVCATELRRRRKRGLVPAASTSVYINSQVCEGCGDCGAVSNCVGLQPLQTPLGTKRRIDDALCNVDLSCLKGFCPSFVTISGKRVDQRELELPVLAPPAQAPVVPRTAILICGIGGSGVVTLSALLGMAAHLDGSSCRVVDQTGMAQKNGAVTSHVLIGPPGASLPSRIATGNADVLIGCDLLGAAAHDNLALMRNGARAALNTDLTATGHFTRNPDVILDKEDMSERIADRIGGASVTRIDATRVSYRVFGTTIFSNIIMLGSVWQMGLVPISREAIERAIDLNGVSVAENRAAFEWGRASAEGQLPSDFEQPDHEFPSSGDMELADLERRLIAYQNRAYAARFKAIVTEIREAEARCLGENAGLDVAVARSLFKLMSYKDEYEVARLLTDPKELSEMRRRHAKDARLTFYLAPPFLAPRDRDSGVPVKLPFGEWILPFLRLLSKLRRLRGGALDVFGYSPERRQERADFEHYAMTMVSLTKNMTPESLPLIRALAELPMRVRGFGHVKNAARLRWKAEERDLLDRLHSLSA